MELRDIEILLTLSEELHFGRTAERLHLTQARVSQSIKKQERRIGAPLFERTSRHVTLTPIGQRLVQDLRPVQQALRESLERARTAARGKTDVLRLGMISWNLQDIRPILDEFAERRPSCEVQIRSVSFGDPFGPLRNGDVDAALIWLPVREPDLTVGPVAWTEPIVLALSTAHPLAQKASVSYEDLGDQTVMGGATPEYWREALVPSRTPSGSPIRVGPIVTTFEQMIPILVTGEAISPVQAQAVRLVPRDDIAYVPIEDAPLARWALIWRTATETELVRDFAAAIEAVGPIEL